MAKQTLTILGATGSIGQSTLSIVRAHPNDFDIYALTGYQNIKKLYEQCIEFQPKIAVVASQDAAITLQDQLDQAGVTTKVQFGQQALCDVASAHCVESVMAAIVGIAGLEPTMAAVMAGKRILLANKEALVTAGEIFMKAVEQYGATLLPVDSEHNAIFQCLDVSDNLKKHHLEKIVLTASGGPFRTLSLTELTNVTPDQACQHPNWDMGAKISVDSATMVNKALEVVEAAWLFKLAVEKIDVLIHPQSIIHSFVHYQDGSWLAQLGVPDMETPISYALYYPNRAKLDLPSLDLTAQDLTFEPVDLQRFKALELVFNLLRNHDYGGLVVFNAANEVFVEQFLAGNIRFTDITDKLEMILSQITVEKPQTIADVIALDSQTRQMIQADTYN